MCVGLVGAGIVMLRGVTSTSVTRLPNSTTMTMLPKTVMSYSARWVAGLNDCHDLRAQEVVACDNLCSR